MKKKVLLAVLIITLLLTAVLLFPQQPGNGQSHIVTLHESGFVPQTITIRKGDSVTFASTLSGPFWPASDLHPTHGIYPEFDPQEPVEAGNNWQFTFNKKGSFKYHDHLHPLYRAAVIVE